MTGHRGLLALSASLRAVRAEERNMTSAPSVFIGLGVMGTPDGLVCA
jgi:hypothetical protein